MTKKFLLQVAVFLCIAPLLWGCFGKPAPINVKYIKTVVNEDGSGSNSFRLAMPQNENCELRDFRPALDQFQAQSNTTSEKVLVSKFDDGVDRGWDVTIKFDFPEQISAQVEGLKRSIVTTLKNSAIATDQTTNWDAYSATNDNEFSVKLDHPASTEQGREWNVAITVSPALLATPEADCSYPQLEYEIVMPGKVKSYNVSVAAYSGLFENILHQTIGGAVDRHALDSALVERVHDNTLLWKIRPKSVGEMLLEEDGIDLVQLSQTTDSATLQTQVEGLLYDHIETNQDDRAAIERVFGAPIQRPEDTIVLLLIKPIYTIQVTSATPVSLTQFLVSNITPIVLLVGGILGAIYTVVNIRQAMAKRREKAYTMLPVVSTTVSSLF